MEYKCLLGQCIVYMYKESYVLQMALVEAEPLHI